MGEEKDRVALFRSPWRKLERAKAHIQNLYNEITAFEIGKPYRTFCEIDPDGGNELLHKIKLTEPFPESFSEILGDALNNMRESLDYAGFAVAIANGRPKGVSATFPFGRTAEDVKRCIDRSCNHSCPKQQLL